VLVPGFDPRGCRLTVNRWIAGATRDCAAAVTRALEGFRFDEAAHHLYHFVWGTFCDWYLEFTKPILQGDDAGARAETQATTAWALAQTVHLLHPIMPFITEELWQQLAGADAGMLIVAPWPDLAPDLADPGANDEMEWVVAAISAIRAKRSELKVPARASAPILVLQADEDARIWFERHREHFLRLAHVPHVKFAEAVDDQIDARGVRILVSGSIILLEIGDAIDLVSKVKETIAGFHELQQDAQRIEKRLNNPQFLAKAKPEFIDNQKKLLQEITHNLQIIRNTLDDIVTPAPVAGVTETETALGQRSEGRLQEPDT
jgi:valyl-tRNA synthetase